MEVWIWLGFFAIVFSLLAFDLGVLNKKDHVVKVPEALAWTAFWVSLALVFNVVLFYGYENHWMGLGQDIGNLLTGKQAGIQFLTGYVIEKSLSLDNVFVIALIFTYFKVPLHLQHRVLFWGIFGAVLFRCVMILAGAALLARFSWINYLFGAFLIMTAVKLLVDRHDNLDLEKNVLVRFIKKIFPITPDFHGHHFFIKQNGQHIATPLLLALLVVETADIAFAVDSIPAIFAVTKDPFIVFTSNVFAILGLRSLYFALAGMMEKFRFIKISLVFILTFVGVKMLIIHHFTIPAWVSLSVILGLLSVGVFASLFGLSRDTKA